MIGGWVGVGGGGVVLRFFCWCLVVYGGAHAVAQRHCYAQRLFGRVRGGRTAVRPYRGRWGVMGVVLRFFCWCLVVYGGRTPLPSGIVMLNDCLAVYGGRTAVRPYGGAVG